MSEKKYYYQLEGKKVGPFTLLELAERQVKPNYLIWCEDFSDWMHAKDVPEIIDFFKQLYNKKQSGKEIPAEVKTEKVIPKKLKVEIIAISSQESSQSYIIENDKTTIGRKNNSGPASKPDIEIDNGDKYISKKHVEIIKSDDETFVIYDLNSTNGTWVNDEKLEAGIKKEMSTGDILKIGRTRMKITIV